ncbi:PREDICTED: DDB1- and CUL4-associated factor 8-like [Ipomoea nil]|uniref:DDB1- and CUL4-associated factor 8-like n=1 Tax=Ipomoea nil TaxID=35883 RepID=UPI0009014F1F|nr:PREDICTED: DDB1- and CUL4-associated factor 8-like [Ipomoea nil]
MEKLYRPSKDDIFTQFWKRESGFSAPRNFSRRVSASEPLVKRLDLYGKLNGHLGCVNTIDFNSTGDILVSGSDDKQIILWEWATKTSKMSYASGHSDNIFQAKFMPLTDDGKIVTSSADGQVRLGQVLQNGRVDTKRIGKHQGRVHKIAVEPGSPYIFYSCGEDGFVQHYDLRSNSATNLFSCSSLRTNSKQSSNSIRLNAIVIDPRNPNFFAIGGSDEYARVYDIRKCQLDASNNSDMPINTFCPRHLNNKQDVHITALAYSCTSELLVSYNDELVYLFQKNMGLAPGPSSVPNEDAEKLEDPQVYTGHRNSRTVKGVSFFGPNDEYVLSGSDCGHIFVWKKKGAKLVRMMVGDRHIVNQLKPHPYIPVFATCGIEKNIKLWTPSSKDINPLPRNATKLMEANKQEREDHSRVALTPDVVMHVLRLHRRQALAYIERRRGGEDIDSDEEDEREAYVLGFSDVDSEDGGGNPRECNIS